MPLLKCCALFISFILVGWSLNSLADTEIENATLERIDHLLAAIKPLINTAQSNQDTNQRVQFQYDPLRRDVEKIQQGIEQKLHQTPVDPRAIIPISGDYLPNLNK